MAGQFFTLSGDLWLWFHLQSQWPWPWQELNILHACRCSLFVVSPATKQRREAITTLILLKLTLILLMETLLHHITIRSQSFTVFQLTVIGPIISPCTESQLFMFAIFFTCFTLSLAGFWLPSKLLAATPLNNIHLSNHQFHCEIDSTCSAHIQSPFRAYVALQAQSWVRGCRQKHETMDKSSR